MLRGDKMEVNEYLKQLNELEVSLGKAKTKISKIEDNIDRCKTQIRDLNREYAGKNITEAVYTVKAFCDTTNCYNCPFYERNPFINKECKLFKTIPKNWNI